MTDSHPIPLARPAFDEREQARVAEVLRSGWVTQGPVTAAFEAALAERVGAAEAVATSSCTTALFLSLHALGIGPGDEVIVPSLSFIASANAIVHCGATPVFVDIDPLSYNLDPEQVDAGVSARTRAILAVHQVGLPADLDALETIARRHGLTVVEDAACAIGSTLRGRAIGGSGNLACFSFHPRKIVCTGEGGMITTNDAELAARLRRLRHQGMSVSDLERHAANDVVIEEYPEIGYNFRLSDVHAAIGLAQLEKLDAMLAERKTIAADYARLLEVAPGIEPPQVPAFAVANFQSYLVRVPGLGAEGRNAVIQRMQQRGIATRRGLMAIHREAPYRQARRVGDLQHTERATDETLAIPIYAGLTRTDRERVARELITAVDRTT